MFIDSHAHITDELLAKTTNQIVLNMSKDNLGIILNVGYSLENSKKCIQLCKKFEGERKLFASIGIHPHYAKTKWKEDYKKEIIKLSKDKHVIAIGEIGIDYHYEGFDKALQKEYLVRQIEIANSLNLPVIFHMRECEQDFKQILIDNLKNLNNGILFHCFNGSEDFLDFALKNLKNVYFAFGGQVTYPKTNNANLAAKCPLDRMLLETDCPYLTPEPLRGNCLNEPKLIKYVYEKVADIKNITIKELEEAAEKNFKRLFKI